MTDPTPDQAPDGLNVVLGAGAVGLAVAEELARQGGRVRVVNRSGEADAPDGVEVVAADLSDPGSAEKVTQDAAIVYHAVNPPYARWLEQFPPLHTAIISAARSAGARLVMIDNLYMYGRPGPKPMTEESPVAPATAKGELRARMAAELLEAHHRGDVRVSIGRASDYFGPRGLTSQLGERVFRPLLAGKKAQVLGDPDTLHTYTFLPDIAQGLITLAAHDEALGEVWHLPSPPAVTTRQVVEMIGEQIGRSDAGLSVMPPALLTALAWVSPMLRAVRQEVYQVESDWVMDDSKYRETFGDGATPLPAALGVTLDWYRAHP